MKIEQGYTLSQFVDYATSHNEEEWTCKEIIDFANSIDCYVGSEIATKIHDYNNFLKQPLSKEMFVNEVENPEYKEHYQSCKCNECNQIEERFEEAESKVIFENVIVTKNESCSFSTIFVNYAGGKIKIANDFNSDVIFAFNTISDLFDYTKGRLKLKNVEL